MFVNVTIGVVNFAFPDDCKAPTPAGPVPVLLVNVAISFSHIPVVLQIVIGRGLAENILTTGAISNGDEAGVAMGVVPNQIVGPDRYVTCSEKVCLGGMPAVRLTSLTGQNGALQNAMGASLTSAQFIFVLLS